MDGSRVNSSSNDSRKEKDKQRLKRSLSETDLQHKTDRFQHDILHQLKKPRIENNSKSINQAKDQPTQEIEKTLEQCAQVIMSRYFRDIPKLLADFERQGVRLLHPGESSSTVAPPIPSQKYSEESTLDALPDESVRTLHKTHASAFKRVFQPAFELARQENQSEGDALFQATSHALQFAYQRAYLRAQKLVLQQINQKVDQQDQELHQSITNLQQEYLRKSMYKEIDDTILVYTRKILKEYKQLYKSKDTLTDIKLFMEKDKFEEHLRIIGKDAYNILLKYQNKGLKNNKNILATIEYATCKMAKIILKNIKRYSNIRNI